MRILAMALCPSMFIYDKSEFYQNGWTNRADLGIGASFHPSYTVWKGNSGISKKGYFPLELSPKLRTENFASVYRSRKRYQLRSRQVDAQTAWKPNRRRSTKLTISLSSYARPLLYHSNHQALSTLQHNSDARVNSRQLALVLYITLQVSAVANWPARRNCAVDRTW